MPSFRPFGFTAGSLVAMTIAQGAASAQAAVTWGQPGGGGQPNAAFSIVRTDGIPNGEIIAPLPAWFKAVNLSGFAYTEPAGDTNVYDPTYSRITWIWDFGDPGYVPITTPNSPNIFRDMNIGRGRQACHVFRNPGAYTVTCWAFDDQGNWGTASYRFAASGGDAPLIIEPNGAFANANTIVFSQEAALNPALWAGEPPGATRCTTWAAVQTALSARFAAGATLVRIMFRRGETYTNLSSSGLINPETRGVHYAAYGSGTGRAKIFNLTSTWGPFYLRDVGRHSVIMDIDWEGPYNAANETGLQTKPMADLGEYGTHHLWYRCKISGVQQIDLSPGNSAQRIVADCEITNWQNYGLYTGGVVERLGLIGNDIAAHPDALTGSDIGTANTLNILIGNQHGAVRIGTSCVNMYVSGNSMLTRSGWSTGSGNGSTYPPTAVQPAFRNAIATLLVRTSAMFERNVFEGSGDMVRFAALFNGAIDDVPRNYVIDGNFFAACPTTEEFINSGCHGMTIRNNLFSIPAGFINQARMANPFVSAIRFSGVVTNPAVISTSEVYNNTFVILKSQAEFGTVTAPVMVTAQANMPVSQSNNIIHAPNLSSPITTFAPLASTGLAGFVPRYKGTRWSFAPLRATVSTVREGGAGAVANGEWVALDYPNYAGRNGTAGNALAPLTRAQILANSGQYHQVSVSNYAIKAMAPAAAGGDGRVVFDFPVSPNKIRIQNNSGGPWPGDGTLWVFLDLRDYLMGFMPNTSTEAATYAGFIPQTGSAGIVVNRSNGLWAHGGFSVDYREGVKIPPSGAVQTGKTHKLGAFA